MVVIDETTFAVGQRHEVVIADLAFGGEGVGRLGEFVVFVPFVIPGETVEIELLEVKKRFGRARLVRVIHASKERVDPQCRYFGDCGGCQYQHIDYSAQLRFKQKQITDLFERIGGFKTTAIDPVVPCPAPYGYRNRIMIRTQWNKHKQGLEIGFVRTENKWVVDIEECKIAEPTLNEEIKYVRAHPPHKGGLKVVLRIPPAGWVVPKDSFFQNNFHLLPQLVEGVRRSVKAGGVRHLIDVYCGVGFFALELADIVDRFVGVELDRLAINAARQNALSRGVTNGEFVDGDAQLLLPRLLEKFPAAQSAVILDPPRVGCPPESIELLRRVRPAQIIYVSCHPATLARDLKLLCEGGLYELSRLTPYDMFPQTQHVECVADLRFNPDAVFVCENNTAVDCLSVTPV